MEDRFTLTAANPIIGNHRVFNQPLLPGLAYIDLIYQLFRDKGYLFHQLVLKNLSLYIPLVVQKNAPVNLILSCVEENERQWFISIEGTIGQGNKITYASAQVAFTESTFLKAHHNNPVPVDVKRSIDLLDIYAICRQGGLVHDGIMKANGQVICTGEFYEVSIETDNTDNDLASAFMFHPTLIDGSAIACGGALMEENHAAQGLFLPIHFESFQANDLITQKLHTRIERESIHHVNELIIFSMEFFNEHGQKIGELKNLSNKLVREAGLNMEEDIRLPSEKRSVFKNIHNNNLIMQPDTTAVQGIESYLKTLIANQLDKRAEEINPEDGYYELGLASKDLLKIVEQLGKKLNTDLPPTLLFEYTSVSQLAVYFAQHHAEVFQTFHSTIQTEIKQATTRNVESNEKQEIQIPARQEREDIAIIGLAGRYPGADNIYEFWENLVNGKDTITEIPIERWDWRSYDGLRSPSGKKLSKWGGFINDPYSFDAPFFRISAREAEVMDPQERVLLEVCWEALEDAGYTPENIVQSLGIKKRKSVGVFIGAMHKDYTVIGAGAMAHGQTAMLSLNSAPISNRISYFCNFHGPSMTIDTACSSSLTALHQAILSIRCGESKAALVGGVNLSLHPAKYITYGLADMHSSNGRCNTFGKGGDGYVSSEGVGIVVIKPLHQAIQDNDRIYAVIKGSAINHGGTVSGVTVPSPVAQAELIATCIENAHIDPRTISYMEAHGTGTSLGDPIEIQGLTNAFQQFTADNQFCAIGSVKSNMGHAEAVAGICGLTKVILQLHHKKLVPSLHSEELNPYINFQQTPFFVQHKTEDWVNPVIRSSPGNTITPLRAGLSSFGATGTNVHVILEEYNSEKRHIEKYNEQPTIIPISAKNSERLKAYAYKLLSFLEKNNDELTHGISGKRVSSPTNLTLPNIAYTLQLGRIAMEERVAFVVNSIGDLREKLRAFYNAEKNIDHCFHGQIQKHKDILQHFNQDEQIQGLTKQWIGQSNLTKIAELWANGLSINWRLFYQDVDAHTIGLPTYSFAKKNYTLTGGMEIESPGATQVVNEVDKKENILKDLLYIPVWERQLESIPPFTKRYAVAIILFTTQSETFAKWTADYLKKQGYGERVVQISLGSATKQINENHWTCNVSDANAIGELLSNYPQPESFFFISTHTDSKNSDSLDRELYGDEVQLLRLIKFLKTQPFQKKIVDAYIVTADNFSVANSEIRPESAGITGLAYAIAQGDFRFAVRNIDVTAADCENQENANELIPIILREPSTGRGDIAKIQGGIRYKQSVLKLDPVGFISKKGVKENGVYVILGGSGTVGEVITRNLIAKYNAIVICIGRKPADSEYIRQKMNSCSVNGNKPIYLQADVNQPDELKAALSNIRKSFPKINGAIFSGIVFNKDNSIDKTTETEFNEILEIKTRGSINFYNAFRDEALDFMCFFSSSQAFSFSGAANFSAYTSGITFSDAYAKAVHQNSEFPVGIINWGFWKSTLKGISTENLSTKNIGLLEDEEGFACFENFVGLLQEGKLQQVICMKTSEAVANLMTTNTTEVISISPNKTGRKTGALNVAVKSGERIEALLNSVEAKNFNNWIAKLLFVQLQKSGLFTRPDETGKASDLLQKAGIIEKYERWFNEILEVLTTNDFIHEVSGQFQVTEKGMSVDDQTWNHWHEIKNSIGSKPDTQAQVQLIDNCLQQLPNILKGEVLATDILFPNGSMSLVAGIYTGNKLADYFNDQLSEILKEYITLHLNDTPERKIRILEAGAGTGGTSSSLFPMLNSFSRNIEYVYTDISRSFLHFAREKFTQYNFITYALCDIGKDVSSQNIQANSFDVVIATNVFHATHDIRKAIRNTKLAMATNGLLLLNEGVNKSLFNTLTFGLLDGWWAHTDEYLRIPGSPLLSVASWQRVLEEEGFKQIQFVPGRIEKTGQKIIIAESDGLVRRTILAATKKSDHISEKELSQTERKVLPQKEPSTNGIVAGTLKEYVENLLTHELSLALKTSRDSIENTVAFYEYGVDSIIGVTFINKVNDLLGIKLNSAILFDYTTVEQLTDFILDTCSDSLASMIKNSNDKAEPILNREKIMVGSTLVEESNMQKLLAIDDLESMFFQDKISTESLLETISNQFIEN